MKREIPEHDKTSTWVYKGKQSKMVSAEEAEQALKNGWSDSPAKKETPKKEIPKKITLLEELKKETVLLEED